MNENLTWLAGLFRRYHWMLIAVVAILVVGLIAGGSTSPAPYDPNSSTSNGTKGLVLLLRALGANVDVGPVLPAGSGVALLLEDQLNNHDENALASWVDSGHTLVVTAPSSPLAGVSEDTTDGGGFLFDSEDIPLQPECSLIPLQQIDSIEPEGGDLLQPTDGQPGCFPAGQGDFMVARPEGDGTVVVLGGPQLWTNAELGQADNSVLAAVLLAPVAGTDVTVIGASRVGAGDHGLLSLISPRLKEGFWQLVIAFVLIALWRARRLGRPVLELLPVELPASELVLADGNLSQEAGHRGRAAQLLRDDLRRTLSTRLSLPSGTTDDIIAAAGSSRTGVSEAYLLETLSGPPPANDKDLLSLAQSIETIRQEVAHDI